VAHIGLCRESEDGVLIAIFADGVDSRIVDRAPPDGACLRFIDPYGDLVINQLQLPQLTAELRELGARSDEPDLRAHVEGLLRFLDESRETHVYMRFVGD
jgi:hypothetical protein